MQVFLIAAQTNDGFIARDEEQNSMEWTSGADKKFFMEKTKEAGVVIMGRKTYETIGKPLPNRKNIIMSRSADPLAGVTVTSDTPQEIIAQLILEGHESVAICGGASIYKLFLDAGLIDTAYVTVEKNVAFEEGIPLFDTATRQKLEEVVSIELGPNTILYEYKIQN